MFLRPALPADNVHTIQLPVAGCSIPEGTICKMYGWGETKGTNIIYWIIVYISIFWFLCLQYVNPGFFLTLCCTVLYLLQQNTGNEVQFLTLSGTGYEDMLKAVELPIVRNNRCREMHRGNLHITTNKICAGGKRNEGVCEVNCCKQFVLFS